MNYLIVLVFLISSVAALNVPKSKVGLDGYHKKHYKPRDGKYDQDHLNLGINENVMSRASNEGKDFWYAAAQDELTDALGKADVTTAKAKNIIIFIGDGTGIGTMSAARLAKGFDTSAYERQVLEWETFPYTGIIKTYNTNMQVTDSAAASTAYSTGAKANQATLGVDANVPLGSCPDMINEAYHTQSVLRDFQLDGRSTGIVTTTRVTHASPAGNYAHTAERHWENDDDMNDENSDSTTCDDIAEQLIKGDTGKAMKVILGGGRRGFLPKEYPAEGKPDPEGCDLKRDDKADLIETWKLSHNIDTTGTYIWNRNELLDLDVANTDYLLGLFDCSHMEFHVDGDTSNPSLTEMTTRAIQILQKDSNGFFLFVEGGLIDKAHHLNEHRSAMAEALEFEKAVAAANSLTSASDTLIIVTADHSQPMQMNGYTARFSDVRGLADTVSDIDGFPYSIMMYTNGPGFRARDDVSTEDWTDDHFAGAAAIPNEESFHSGEDVVLFARGPQSHLFTGIHENSYIPAVFRYAACVGDGLQFCTP